MCSIAFPSESTTSTITPTPDNDLQTARAARNKRNAQKSTGPRTKEGKHRSAQNARTHGLTSSTPPTQVPVPDPTAQLAYTALHQELTEEHRPTTPTQKVLIDELALVVWKLQYLPRIEHRLLNTPLDPNAHPQTPSPDPAQLTPHPRLDHPGDPTAAVWALHLAQDIPTPLTRLHALHHRLQARLNSILNQLRRLRIDHKLHHLDDQDLARAQRNARTDQELAHRHAQLERERKQDHDTLTQMVNDIRDRNHQRDEQQYQARLHAPKAPPQNEPTVVPNLKSQVSNLKSPLPSLPSTPSPHLPTAPARNEPTPPPISNLKSPISNPNPQSPFRIPQSAIGNPRSAILPPSPPFIKHNPHPKPPFTEVPACENRPETVVPSQHSSSPPPSPAPA